MKRIRFMLCVCVMYFFTGNSVDAQTTPQPLWYFLHGEDEHTIIAIASSGETKILPIPLELSNSEWTGGYRLAADKVLRVDQDTLILLNPDAVISFPNTSGLGNPIAYSAPYALIEGKDSAFLLNVEIGDQSPLTGQVRNLKQFARFSADGQRLYYWSRSDNSHWMLYDRDLTSGEETALTSILSPLFGVASGDSTGTYWVYPNAERRFVLYSPTGPTVETFQAMIGDKAATITGDDLLIFDPACTAACPMTIQPLSGGARREITLSTGMPIAMYSVAGGIVLANRQSLAIADDTAEVTILGDTRRFGVGVSRIWCNRWIVLLDRQAVKVWDSQQPKIVIELNTDEFPDNPRFFCNPEQASFVLGGLYYREGAAVENVTGAVALLSDNSILIERQGDDLVLFNPTTDEETSIYEGKFSLMPSPSPQ